MGFLSGCPPTAAMTLRVSRLLAILPYVGLATALLFCTWAFLQSEHYRRQTDEMLSQTYEIQWRAAQIRERLVRANSYIRIASETGKLDPDVRRQITLVRVNLEQLLALYYIDRFLSKKYVISLLKIKNGIEKISDSLTTGTFDFTTTSLDMNDIEKSMYEVSGATVNHGTALQGTAQIDSAASRNLLFFAITLGLVAVFYFLMHQRYAFVSRRDQHLRSFASLFAHMTRSRVTALRLFLETRGPHSPLSEEMLTAAQSAANELEAINDGLLRIAFHTADWESKPLGEILHEAVRLRKGAIEPSITIDKAVFPVPMPTFQFHLLVDELLQNAETAVKNKTLPEIAVRAEFKKPRFFGRSAILLQISDNGVGMTPEVCAKATAAFFSTKAGNHVGLGLTGCAQMAATFRGKLTIVSSPNCGTVIQVRIPTRPRLGL
ncbi:ATP-binding protein [Mesorhizobium sp. NPDC059025]|uniref:ATP-binding protein n=1 Tax=unclassified Mesorhizobium TaxID=325217 RepID=UPI0036A6A11B